MGHWINALVGAAPELAEIVKRFGAPQATPLPFDLLIVPLGDERLDRLSGGRMEPVYDGFEYLGPALESGIARATGNGRLLYIETAYHGGDGGQGAALFEGGKLAWKEAISTEKHEPCAKSPISHGLSLLGVSPRGHHDEFDVVGLGRFRSLHDLGLDQGEDQD